MTNYEGENKMNNRNDRRESPIFDEDEFENMNRRNCKQEEEDNCHHKRNDRFAEALEEAFNEGYKKGYCAGHEEGYEKGYVEGYEEGLRAGAEKAREEILALIKKNRCRRRCCRCRRCKCCRVKCC